MAKDNIILSLGTTIAEVLPKEGGVVSCFAVEKHEVFFPQEIFQTERGLRKRGGLPLLFPNANPITEEQNLFKLPQHGFARDLPWEVSNQTENSVTLKLTSTPATKEKYPFDFELELKVKIQKNLLQYSLTVFNKSNTPLPIAPGLHPYFYIPIAKKKSVKTNIPFFDPQKYEFNETLFFPGQESVEIAVPEIGKITMMSSKEFKVLVVWSEPNRDHICFEPWVGPTNAILHPQQRLEILPNKNITLGLEIRLAPSFL